MSPPKQALRRLQLHIMKALSSVFLKKSVKNHFFKKNPPKRGIFKNKRKIIPKQVMF